MPRSLEKVYQRIQSLIADEFKHQDKYEAIIEAIYTNEFVATVKGTNIYCLVNTKDIDLSEFKTGNVVCIVGRMQFDINRIPRLVMRVERMYPVKKDEIIQNMIQIDYQTSLVFDDPKNQRKLAAQKLNPPFILNNIGIITTAQNQSAIQDFSIAFQAQCFGNAYVYKLTDKCQIQEAMLHFSQGPVRIDAVCFLTNMSNYEQIHSLSRGSNLQVLMATAGKPRSQFTMSVAKQQPETVHITIADDNDKTCYYEMRCFLDRVVDKTFNGTDACISFLNSVQVARIRSLEKLISNLQSQLRQSLINNNARLTHMTSAIQRVSIPLDAFSEFLAKGYCQTTAQSQQTIPLISQFKQSLRMKILFCEKYLSDLQAMFAGQLINPKIHELFQQIIAREIVKNEQKQNQMRLCLQQNPQFQAHPEEIPAELHKMHLLSQALGKKIEK